MEGLREGARGGQVDGGGAVGGAAARRGQRRAWMWVWRGDSYNTQTTGCLAVPLLAGASVEAMVECVG
jgi:hypothetical protein